MRDELIAVVAAGTLTALYFWYATVKEDRAGKQRREERQKLEKKMHVDHRDDWSVEDLAPFNGQDLDKPILFAANGRVRKSLPCPSANSRCNHYCDVVVCRCSTFGAGAHTTAKTAPTVSLPGGMRPGCWPKTFWSWNQKPKRASR